MHHWRLALLALFVPLLLAATRPSGLGDVREVRHWSYPDYTRVVIELDRAVQIPGGVKRLPADAKAGRPERIYVDVEGIWVGKSYEQGIAVRDGLLEGVRIGQFSRHSIRVVVDLEHYHHHRLITLSHPDRLVLDIYGTRGEEQHDEQGRRLPASRDSIRTVVLDPGHGGRDPGAIGIGGVRESHVTLALARSLAEELRGRGFDVVLTRDEDRYIDLEERTAIAEASRGDLFVSLHANAARRVSVRGVETYYLDADHERHSLTVAARENGVDPSEVNELQRTLAKLRVSEVSPHSRRLAELIQHRIVSGMPGPFRPVPDLGVKKGPFYVLFLSSMPAVLVEAGFLTNRTEAKRLRDEGYRDALAEQIARALVDYRDSGPTLAFRSVR